MFDRELTIDLSEVGRIIPTQLGISRPTLTMLTCYSFVCIFVDSNITKNTLISC